MMEICFGEILEPVLRESKIFLYLKRLKLVASGTLKQVAVQICISVLAVVSSRLGSAPLCYNKVAAYSYFIIYFMVQEAVSS